MTLRTATTTALVVCAGSAVAGLWSLITLLTGGDAIYGVVGIEVPGSTVAHAILGVARDAGLVVFLYVLARKQRE